MITSKSFKFWVLECEVTVGECSVCFQVLTGGYEEDAATEHCLSNFWVAGKKVDDGVYQNGCDNDTIQANRTTEVPLAHAKILYKYIQHDLHGYLNSGVIKL